MMEPLKMRLKEMQAMFVSFGMAEQYDGTCFLRFDDTNPEAEKQEYIDHIEDIVAWMGWKPSKVPFCKAPLSLSSRHSSSRSCHLS